MFRRKRSYTDEDVYLTAMRWQQIVENAEEEAARISQGMLQWVNESPENKAKVHKALGIQHGFILASFRGDPHDFEDFFRDVIYRASNYIFCFRFGRMIYREHKRLRRQMETYYFRGIEDGRKQYETGENMYLLHRRTWV